MFEKLKAAFGSLAQITTHKSLSAQEIDAMLWNLEIALIESDVAQEVIESINTNLRQELLGTKIARSENSDEFVQNRVKSAIRQSFSKTPKIEMLTLARTKSKSQTLEERDPFVILFLGINGTGKTTTVAKVANLLLKNGLSVVMACGDTHRAGAIEQLKEHANRLKIKAIAQAYGSDPAAVAKDAQLYARSHNIDVALIDSAGRIQTNKNLMDEMAKISRVVSPDLKIFVGDSLAGNDAISQAIEFKKSTDFNAAILTKADADVRGGAALSIVFTTERPIIYLGVGQNYDDLVPFDVEEFIESIFDSDM